jgi:hypothetical protein
LERKRTAPGLQHRDGHFDRCTDGTFRFSGVRLRSASQSVVHIIINNILEPTFQVTKPKTLAITARAFNTLIKSDFYDTILGSYLFAVKQGFKFNLAYIPNNFKFETHELIDPNYMNALFELGRSDGRLGGNWEHLPPRLYR